MKFQTIERTNYFYKTSTWVKRFILIFIILGPLLIWEVGYESYFLYIIALFLVVAIVIARENDLAFDDKYLYHIRTSIISELTKVQKIEISKINSIRWRAYESEFWSLLGKRSLDGLDYGVEITFNDNSSLSLNVNIYKKDMDRILKKVKFLIEKKA